jgi:hypothetical protein
MESLGCCGNGPIWLGDKDPSQVSMGQFYGKIKRDLIRLILMKTSRPFRNAKGRSIR